MMLSVGLSIGTPGKAGTPVVGPIAVDPPSIGSASISPASAMVGDLMTVTVNGLAGAAPITLTYDWKLDGASTGAKGNTYTAAAPGSVAVDITASNSEGTVTYTTAPAFIAGGASNLAVLSLAEQPRDEIIFDSGIARGLDAARVPVSGTTDAPDGTIIETRAVSVDDGGASTTPWQDAASANGGNWSGTLSAPRSDSWYVTEARVKGSSAPAARSTTRFGSGFVVAFTEQSNMARGLTSDDSNTIPETIGVSASDPQFFYYGDLLNRNANNNNLTTADPNYGDRQAVPVVRAVNDDTPRSASLAAMAAQFNRHAPGLKVLAIFDALAGVSQAPTLRAADDQRMMSKIGELIDLATGGTRDVGLFVQSHPNSLPSQVIDEFYAGTNLHKALDGSDLQLPLPSPFPTNVPFGDSGIANISDTWPEVLPGLLTGETILSIQRGGFNPDRPTTAVPEEPNGAGHHTFDFAEPGFANLVAAFPNQVRFSGIHRAHKQGAANDNVGKPRDGSQGGSILHFDDADDFGMPQRFRSLAVTTLHNAGILTFRWPRFDTIEWTTDYVRLASSSGPVSTTARLEGGMAAGDPVPQSIRDRITAKGRQFPAAGEIIGFFDANLDILDARIVDAAGNPALAGEIRVYPPAGQTFDNSSRVYFGAGQAFGLPTGQDYGLANEYWVKHLAAVDVGLSDPRLLGITVDKAANGDWEFINAANDLSGAAFFTVNNSQPQFRTGTNIGGGRTKMTVATRLRRNSQNMPLVKIGPNGFNGRVLINGNGGVRVEIDDGGNNKIFDKTTRSGLVDHTGGVFRDVVVSMNIASGEEFIEVFVDGVPSGEPAFGAGTLGSMLQIGQSFANKPLDIFSGASGTTDIEYMQVWLDATGTASEPSGTPFWEVSADGAGGFVQIP